MNRTDIMKNLPNLSVEDLRALNKAVVDTLKAKLRLSGTTIKSRLVVGQVAFFNKGGDKTEVKIIKRIALSVEC